jgi:glycosyltransferase involved in cell wall biosynthesis
MTSGSESGAALPRVLVLSGAVPETRFAGSLLLYRLFKDYPADRLLAVGPKTHARSETLACRYEYLAPAASARFDLTRLAQLKRSFEAIGWAGRIPPARVDAAIGPFTPDVVVAVMERHDYMDAAYRLCVRRGLPLVLIVHDRLESFELVYAPFRGFQLDSNARIFRFASARLCVSPEMVASLTHVYGAPGTVMYPNRSDDLAPRSACDSAQLKAPPRLTVGYAGSLAYGYGERLRELMPALDTSVVSLRIYSHDTSAASIPGATLVGGFPSAELWRRVKAECDAVWLPYAHLDHYQPLYATHFPSKLTEYMALGMPVVITGPAHATGVKWGVAHPNATVTLPDADAGRIGDTFARLRDDASWRVQIAERAGGGDQDFDPRRIRAQFMDVLRNAAAASAATTP